MDDTGEIAMLLDNALRVSRTIEPTPIDIKGTKLGARFEAHVRNEHARYVTPEETERATCAPTRCVHPEEVPEENK